MAWPVMMDVTSLDRVKSPDQGELGQGVGPGGGDEALALLDAGLGGAEHGVLGPGPVEGPRQVQGQGSADLGRGEAGTSWTWAGGINSMVMLLAVSGLPERQAP